MTENNAAAELIRTQGEQLREDQAEYIARKYGIRSDSDEQEKVKRQDMG